MKHILVLGLLVLMFGACGDSKKSGAANPVCEDTGATGVACTSNDACCTGYCDAISGLCARVPGTCGAADADCSVGPDCCSLSCVDFKCSGDQCTSDAAACGADGECCSGVCGSDGKCAALNPECRTAGNTCGTNGECCSGLCKDGLCNNAPSFCTQTGDACVTAAECCGGACTKTAGASLGTCSVVPSSGASGCTTQGEVCGKGADYNPATDTLPTCGGECCSRACFPYGPTGVLVCQPPSGCRPAGELCSTDQDCCGADGLPTGNDQNKVLTMCRKEPGYDVGRCDQGHMCAPAGDICRLATTSCNDTDTCCAGNVQNNPEVCQQDSLGIPRCSATPGGGSGTCDPVAKVGTACASSADCCGNPCVYLPGSELGYVCGSGCVAAGGACSTTADCCSGLPCNLPPGSSQGTCGTVVGCTEYGQMCDPANNTCCNGLPCADTDGNSVFTCEAGIIF